MIMGGLIAAHVCAIGQLTSPVQKHYNVYLEQLNTAGNFVNGAPFTLLTVVEISRYPAFGSTSTVRFETLELKRLRGGFVSELKVTNRDHTGAVLDNNLQPISVVFEIQKEK